MEACTGKAEEAMEEIIPTIMSALSMNGEDEIMGARRTDSASTTVVRRRSQQLSGSNDSPTTRISLETNNHRGRQEELQPISISTKELCGTTEGAMDEIIPTIMNALSFRENTEEIPRTSSTTTSASRRKSPPQQQQPPEIDSSDTASILKSLDSSFRERSLQQRGRSTSTSIRKKKSVSIDETIEDNNPSIMNSLSSRDSMIPSIMNSLSFSKTKGETIRRNSSDKSDMIPSIVNALSWRDASEETLKRSRSDKTPSSRQLDSTQVPLGRKSSNSSHRRRRPRPQGLPLNDDSELSQPTTITEEDSILGSLSSKAKSADSKKRTSSPGNFSGNALQKQNGDLISSASWNPFSNIEEKDESGNDQAFGPIRNVFTMDDAGTTGNGLSQVYPFIRNVFSINDADSNVPINTTEEISNNSDKVRLPTQDEEEGNSVPRRRKRPTQKIVVTRAYEVKEHYLESIFYVSISAILGSVFRVYMARIFGFDCQAKQADDFLVPFSAGVCVTNNGRTEQTGGALFTDFPSNVFGSFLMGVITPPIDNRRARLPWLHRDHPLQRDEVFHASLGTGFCGCLTTFASWNTQMVVMLDGSYCQLGSQVVTVLFGYLIGLMGASYGFELGRQCGLWMYNFRHRGDDEETSSRRDETGMDDISASQPSLENGIELPDEGIELVDDDNVQPQPEPSHLHKIPLFLAAVALLAGFIIGDVDDGVGFYKGMILLWVMSPVGSLLRWKLSGLNKNKKGRIITNSPGWIPWGTFFANLVATILSACMEGLYHRYFLGANPTYTNEWADATLFALKTGVAGSLSTVSTMVKESVHLSEDHPGLAHGHYYSMLTCVTCCLVGLAVYSTTIRIN